MYYITKSDIILHARGKLYKKPVSSIVSIEKIKNSKKIRISTISNDTIEITLTLKRCMLILPSNFIYINKSLIININYVEELVTDLMPYIIFSNKTHLYISVSDVRRLINYLSTLKCN